MTLLVLSVQAVVFAVWSVLVFRWLFALRREAVRISGSSMPGLPTTLRVFRDGLTSKRYATDRLWIGIATLLLLAASIVFGVGAVPEMG